MTHRPKAESQAPRDEARKSDLVRFSINLNQETAETLKRMADNHGLSFTEIVRRAVGMMDYVESSRANGATLLIEKDGSYKEVVFL